MRRNTWCASDYVTAKFFIFARMKILSLGVWQHNSSLLCNLRNYSYLCITSYFLIIIWYQNITWYYSWACYRSFTFLLNYGVHITRLKTKNRPLRCEIKEVIFHKKEDKIVIAWLTSTISFSLTFWLNDFYHRCSLILVILQNNKSISRKRYDVLRFEQNYMCYINSKNTPKLQKWDFVLNTIFMKLLGLAIKLFSFESRLKCNTERQFLQFVWFSCL